MRFLFVDRILHSVPGEFIRGLKHVTQDDYYLCRDAKGQWCFIPSLVGETLGQLAAWNVMAHCDFKQRPVAGIVAKAYLYRPAYVGETLLLESYIDSLDDTVVQYHSVARIGDDVVFKIDGALGPLLPMETFIDAHSVRRQYAEINRPGDYIPSISINSASNLTASAHCPPMIFDRILESEPGVRLVAEKRVTRAASYFPDHFPNKPVLPLTVLIESQLNLAQEFIKEAGFTNAYRVCEMRKVKMSEFVNPGDTVISTVTVKKQEEKSLILTFRSEVDGNRVCVMDISLEEDNNA